MNTPTLRRALLPFTTFAGALLADVGSKWLIVNVIMQPPGVIEVTSFFNLTLSFNTGVSFGMFRDVFLDRPHLLAGLTGTIAAVLLAWALWSDNRLESFGLGLTAGGAGGNVFDRASQGAVTDFLDVHLSGWHWPTFNMADVAITCGVACLMWSALRPAPTLPAQQAQDAGR